MYRVRNKKRTLLKGRRITEFELHRYSEGQERWVFHGRYHVHGWTANGWDLRRAAGLVK